MMITFNVSGKLFTTRQSSITNDVLIASITHHQSLDDPIFIDRDPEMFRWILYIQREGLMVDHVTVGVPKDVWELELDYFGISEKRQKKNSVIEQRLIEESQNFWLKCKQEKKEKFEQRKLLYLILLDVGSSEFVEADSDIGKTIDCHVFDIDWLVTWEAELCEYAKTLGHRIELSDVGYSNHNFKYYPAKRVNPQFHKKWIKLDVYYEKIKK